MRIDLSQAAERDIESILETAAQEIGRALGVSRTRVRLGTRDSVPPTDWSVTPQDGSTQPGKRDDQAGDQHG